MMSNDDYTIDDKRLDYPLTIMLVIERCDEASITGDVTLFKRAVTTLFRKLTPYHDQLEDFMESWSSASDTEDELVKWQRRYGDLMRLLDKLGVLLGRRELDVI